MAEEQQNQEQQRSSVDRVNDLIGKGRSTYKNAKRLKNTYRAIKRARAVATVVQAAIATSEIWVPALIIGVVFFLIITTAIVVFGGANKTAEEGAGAGEGDKYECTGTCQVGACTGTNIPDTNAVCSASPTDTCCVPLPPPGVQPPLKFYCQYDGWNYSACNIVSYGCTPTSLAMIMSSFGQTFTPSIVSSSVIDPKYNQNIGCGGPNVEGGTSYQGAMAAIAWAKQKGFVVGNFLVGSGATFISNAQLTLMKQYFSSGYFVFIGAVMPFRCSSYNNVNCEAKGHSVVIYDANPTTRTIYYYDPTWCVGRTNSPIVRSMNVSEIKTWYYAIPIKR